MKNSRLITLTLFSMIASHQLDGKFSFENVRSWFSNKGHEEVIDKEFNTEDVHALVLENIDGNITIKTWLDNKVALTAKKRVKKEEDAQKVRISKHDQNGKLIIKSLYQDKIKNAAIDYELMVPSGMRLQLSTKNGSIYLHDIDNPVVASTDYGNVEARNTQKAVKATVHSKGNVAIGNAQGNVYVATNCGSATINDATKNVIAKVTKGVINVSCVELPATSTIQLQAKSGTINLALPASANATIEGSTRRGSLTSDHYLTLKSHTTKLNRQAWNRFKKEVSGILGTGEADVKLSAESGNIKILQAKTA